VYPLPVRTRWFSVGAVLLAVTVAAGAFGAHALRVRLDAPPLALWETAVRYLALGGLGLLALGLAASDPHVPGWTVAGTCLAAGALLFSGTVAAMALGGPRWLGVVTPVGGVLLIAGFLVLAVVAGHRRR
jgi:uncharacterized membrane protein YgdD (TMEM256/DUF423 family)